MKIFRRFRTLLRKGKLDAEMAEEMRLHLELQAERNRAAGMNSAEAQNEAQRQFGNVASLQEQIREQRGWLTIEALAREFRLAGRGLLRQPGFAGVVVLTLALGIGANTAIFTLVNAVLFRPLAIRDEAGLVVLQTEDTGRGESGAGVSYLDFQDWRKAATSFVGMGIVAQTEVVVALEGRALRASGALISPELFSLTGVVPALGRAFRDEEAAAATTAGVTPVMLTHSAWQNLFGGDPAIIGRHVVVDEMPCEVIGVTAAGLFPVAPEPVEIWLTPAHFGDPAREGSANASRAYRPYLGALARLQPGRSIEQARAELAAIHESIRAQHPELGREQRVRVTPLRPWLVGDLSAKLWALAAVVGLVLVIACVNVANLLLSRATVRQRELAVRSALGASRLDLIRQALAETLLLAVLGGGFGWLLAWWAVAATSSALPAGVPQLNGLAPDLRVLVFTGAVVLLTGLVCGLLPASVGGAIAPNDALKDGGRGSRGTGHGRIRQALVVGQVALTLALLVVAGLVVRSLEQLHLEQPGYRTEQVLTAQVSLAGQRYVSGDFDPRAINGFLARLTEALEVIPGVNDVSHAQSVPLTGVENNTSFAVLEQPSAPGSKPSAQLRFIAHNYLAALEIPVREGRGFGPADGPDAPAVALVNEAFVREHLGGRHPVGLHLKMGWGGYTPKEIVGVVADVRHRSPGDAPRPEVYVPQAQFANGGITLILRTAVRPEALADAIRREVWRLDPYLPVTDIVPLAEYRSRTLSGQRFAAFLLGLFSVTALGLTVAGLYGVMSHQAASRRQEMGIRAALGAQPSDLYRLILGEGLRLTGLGIGLGLGLAWAGAQVMRGQLYGVSLADPATYGSLSLLLVGVTLLACWLPARRAAKVDPMIALRAE